MTSVYVDEGGIESIGYNSDTSSLFIKFTEGEIHRYKNVKYDVFSDFVFAPADVYYEDNVKGKYELEQISNEDWLNLSY